MDVSIIIQLGTLISVVIGVIGLLVSIRAYKREVHAQFLLEYTKRVDDMIQNLPRSVWAAHLTAAREVEEASEELTINVLRCLNFVSQVHYFSRKGYMPASTWRTSRANYERVLQSPLFVREWKVLQPVFAGDRAFCRYVERMQSGRRAVDAPA